MNSSTSSSEDRAGSANRAAGFLRTLVGSAAAFGLSILALLVVLDPYDTGRLTPFPRAGVPDTAPRGTKASQSRDPAFNAAIIGNSTLQLLSPERLKQLTGLDFVQLSVPGTGPMEQATMAEYLFARRGAGIGLLVLGLDRNWCDAALETRTINPFPFWLYDLDDFVYLRSLFRATSVVLLPRRLRVIFAGKRAARRDGYWDFETLTPDDGPNPPPLPAKAAPVVAPERPAAVGALERVFAAAPPRTRIGLVHPPVYVKPEEPPDADHRAKIAACKGALAAAAAKRPGSFLVDHWVDDEAARNRSLFIDPIHYRRPLSQRIEAALASHITRGD